MLAALLDAGELVVELGPAGVVVADQDPAVAVHHAQARDRGGGAGVRRAVPDQPLIGGADGDHVRAARLHLPVAAGVADHADRSLIGAQDFLGAQRGPHRLAEPGGVQPFREPLVRAGDETGRYRHALGSSQCTFSSRTGGISHS